MGRNLAGDRLCCVLRRGCLPETRPRQGHGDNGGHNSVSQGSASRSVSSLSNFFPDGVPAHLAPLLERDQRHEERGGFDERFRGYGAEDKGFLVCASTLGGTKQRLPGRAFHLNHPEDPLRTSEETKAGNLLAERYADYDGNEEAIRAMLAER